MQKDGNNVCKYNTSQKYCMLYEKCQKGTVDKNIADLSKFYCGQIYIDLAYINHEIRYSPAICMSMTEKKSYEKIKYYQSYTLR